MSRFSFSAPIAVGALVLLSACGGDKGKADSALAADSSMSRDLALAGRDTAAKPQLTDVPATTAKAKTTAKTTAKTVAKAPPPAPTPARPTSGSIAAGTQLALNSTSEICTNTNKVGDTFTATLASPVAGSNGATIPSGAVVAFTIAKINRSENVNDPIEMVFTVNSVAFGGKTYPVDAGVTKVPVEKVRATSKSTDAKKVVGGAAVGAIAGQLLGKNTKSTVIGAAAGAAVGAGAAVATANYEGCVRNNAPIVVTLNSALEVTIS